MRVEGKVYWFDDMRGFGQIVYNHTNYFVHYTEVTRPKSFLTLYPGEVVEFTPHITNNGEGVAKNVTIER